LLWIFLSPHLDDAVFSCGGLIYELVSAGNEVEVWTVFAGDPPPGPLSPLAQALHRRWQTGPDAPAVRRGEDQTACELLGAHPVHLDIPECIYRVRSDNGLPLIGSNEELFQPLLEIELPLAARIADLLREQLRKGSRLVSPLAIGGHIDHHLVRTAAEALQRPLFYYGDYPYLATGEENPNDRIDPDWQALNLPITSQALAAWQSAAAAYRTQISTFWSSLEDMNADLQQYHQQGGGRLWRPRA
jgi:LmbE family N-acetylglucosaminyl deacetylase